MNKDFCCCPGCGSCNAHINEPKLKAKIKKQAAEIAALREQLTKVRMEAIGWMYSYACNEMDCDRDIRITEVPKIIEQVLIDLGEESK